MDYSYRAIHAALKGKRVENTYHTDVNYYDSPRWDNPSGTFKPGHGWAIDNKLLVNGSPMYREDQFTRIEENDDKDKSSEKELETDEKHSSDKEQSGSEGNAAVETEQVEPSNDNVLKAYTADWKPIGTEQEGPHTTNYEFFEEKPSVETVVDEMMKKTESVLSKYLDEIKQKDYTVHEAVTFASVIEKESGAKDQRKKIAGVFANRLEEGM